MPTIEEFILTLENDRIISTDTAFNLSFEALMSNTLENEVNYASIFNDIYVCVLSRDEKTNACINYLDKYDNYINYNDLLLLLTKYRDINNLTIIIIDKIIYSKKCDLNYQYLYHNGKTALMISTELDNYKLVEKLLIAGADDKIKLNNGKDVYNFISSDIMELTFDNYELMLQNLQLSDKCKLLQDEYNLLYQKYVNGGNYSTSNKRRRYN